MRYRHSGECYTLNEYLHSAVRKLGYENVRKIRVGLIRMQLINGSSKYVTYADLQSRYLTSTNIMTLEDSFFMYTTVYTVYTAVKMCTYCFI